MNYLKVKEENKETKKDRRQTDKKIAGYYNNEHIESYPI